MHTAHKFQHGFTLIETLVGIAILVSMVGGVLTLSQSALTTTREANDRVTAFYLAQDAMEYIIHVRYENHAAGDNWLAKLDPCFAPDSCKVDTTKNDPASAITTCSGDCETLSFVTDGADEGSYNYEDTSDSVRDTQFRRSVQIEKITHNGSEDEIQINVTVRWDGGERELVLQQNLFNWQKFI